MKAGKGELEKIEYRKEEKYNNIDMFTHLSIYFNILNFRFTIPNREHSKQHNRVLSISRLYVYL